MMSPGGAHRCEARGPEDDAAVEGDCGRGNAAGGGRGQAGCAGSADTGRLKWTFQFSPHETHDWDSTHVPVLADLTIAGQPHKIVMVANRNGFFYVFDRVTGKLLVGRPFSDTT